MWRCAGGGCRTRSEAARHAACALELDGAARGTPRAGPSRATVPAPQARPDAHPGEPTATLTDRVGLGAHAATKIRGVAAGRLALRVAPSRQLRELAWCREATQRTNSDPGEQGRTWFAREASFGVPEPVLAGSEPLQQGHVVAPGDLCKRLLHSFAVGPRPGRCPIRRDRRHPRQVGTSPRLRPGGRATWFG